MKEPWLSAAAQGVVLFENLSVSERMSHCRKFCIISICG